MKVDENPSLAIQNLLSQHGIPNPHFPKKNNSIPALILEHNINDEVYFDLEDLKQFYNKFGEVLNIIIHGKQHIVLFKNFLSAKICKIFLEDEENYKKNMKNNFEVRWFDINSDWHLIPDEVKVIFENIKNIYDNNNFGNENNMNNNQMNNFTNNMNRNISQFNYINNMNFAQEQNIFNENMLINNNNFNNNNGNINLNLNGFNNNYINNFGIMNNPNNNFNNINNINNINIVNNMNHINNLNININDNYNYNFRLINKNNFHNLNHNNNINIKNINIPEDKSFQKFVCKYEILIENDSEFQISRKLIGSKGANMKKIINECQIKGETDTVKLRLRGKGSGYKEGPLNKESDEPLHLCISARNKEQLNLACFLVNKLFETIYEEYKFFCKKKGIKPKFDKIARKINENKNINTYFN